MFINIDSDTKEGFNLLYHRGIISQKVTNYARVEATKRLCSFGICFLAFNVELFCNFSAYRRNLCSSREFFPSPRILSASKNRVEVATWSPNPNILTAILRFFRCVNLIASCLESLLSPFFLLASCSCYLNYTFSRTTKCEMISVCWPNFTSSVFVLSSFEILKRAYVRLTCTHWLRYEAVKLKVICCGNLD